MNMYLELRTLIDSVLFGAQASLDPTLSIYLTVVCLALCTAIMAVCGGVPIMIIRMVYKAITSLSNEMNFISFRRRKK